MPNVCILEIKVTNMDEARAFYCDKLGFGIQSDAYLPETLVLEHEGPDLILFKSREPVEINFPDTSQSHLIFQVDDIEAIFKDWSAKGVKFYHSEPEDTPPGRYMAFQDPFGNVHGLMELLQPS